MTAPVGSAAAATPAPEAAPKKDDIAKAAAAFEAILVRQMLASASVAGKGSYADMGVEALSTAVTQGGGLGLGRAIEHAIGEAHRGAHDADTKKKTPAP